MAGICDSQAECKFSAKFGEREHWECQCNAPDWTGSLFINKLLIN